MFVERPRPTDPSVGFCRIPTRSGPTDRPTAARSAAKIRVGPIDRPTRPRAARRKIDGRDRPTDRPCRAQRGAKFTVGTDRPTDPKQLRGKLHHDGCTVLGTDRRSRAQYAVRQNITIGSDRPTDPAVRSAAKNRRSGPTDRPTWPRAARRKFGSDRSTDRPGRAQRGEKSTVGTDRPTDPAARSAAQNLRSGPTERPTQNSLIR